MLALSYLEPSSTASKEVFINPSCVHTKQSVHVRAPAFASAIIPTHVCDRTYTRVKSGSHASEVLITHVSHAYHSCVTRVSYASVNYIASELYYTIDPDTSMFYLHVL